MPVFHHVHLAFLKAETTVSLTQKHAEQDNTLMLPETHARTVLHYVKNVRVLMINVQHATVVMFWMEINVNQTMFAAQETI